MGEMCATSIVGGHWTFALSRQGARERKICEIVNRYSIACHNWQDFRCGCQSSSDVSTTYSSTAALGRMGIASTKKARSFLDLVTGSMRDHLIAPDQTVRLAFMSCF